MPRRTSPPSARPCRLRRWQLQAGAATFALTAVVVVVLLTGSSGNGVATNGATVTTLHGPTSAGGSAADATPTTTPGDAAGNAPASAPGDAPSDAPGPTTTTIPVDVSVSDTSGLRDGDVVSVHATPTPGSALYGFEAFLCQGGTSYRFDADIRPTQTGKCASKPLSAGSEEYKEVRAVPPYESVDSTFAVGVGTDSYQTRDGRTASVTCGPANPCTLVLKLQFPDGFGFRAIDLTYA